MIGCFTCLPQPRSASDYYAIAKSFHTVVVSRVPQMGIRNVEFMRRFVNMVDVFYDERVRVVMSAAASPEKLFVLTTDGEEAPKLNRQLLDDLGLSVRFFYFQFCSLMNYNFYEIVALIKRLISRLLG